MFEYPAPPAHHRTLTPDNAGTAAAALRAHPGEWAVVYTDRSARYSLQVEAGQLAAFPKGEFEAIPEKNDGGKFDVYIRYVGGDPS